jgi:hypothetical protein
MPVIPAVISGRVGIIRRISVISSTVTVGPAIIWPIVVSITTVPISLISVTSITPVTAAIRSIVVAATFVMAMAGRCRNGKKHQSR